MAAVWWSLRVITSRAENSFGVSQAAMLHACEPTPELNYQTDIYHPWTNTDGEILHLVKRQTNNLRTTGVDFRCSDT